MVHYTFDYILLRQLSQNSGQFSIVCVPQLDACGMDRDEYKEFTVEEDIECRVFVN